MPGPLTSIPSCRDGSGRTPGSDPLNKKAIEINANTLILMTMKKGVPTVAEA